MKRPTSSEWVLYGTAALLLAWSVWQQGWATWAGNLGEGALLLLMLVAICWVMGWRVRVTQKEPPLWSRYRLTRKDQR